MTPVEFATKWRSSQRHERAAAQEHFIDLCRMLGVPTPNEADPTGELFAFDKGTEKAGGGSGWADVWKRDHFAWEYKGKRKDLGAAYQQLLQYREALNNPPCLVVCDLDRFEIHTNFTSTAAVVHSFDLNDLLLAPAEPLRLLRALMLDPERLRPAMTVEQVTNEAAGRFAELAETLRERGHPSPSVAHFLSRLLFCFFADGAGLLPHGTLKRLIKNTRTNPAAFTEQIGQLFQHMATGKGLFGADAIQWFNGGLFDDASPVPLAVGDLEPLVAASRLDWSNIEPAILGTLFERGLNPEKRGQLGAHYTDRASIERVIVPVVIRPLRRDLEATKARVLALLAAGKKPTARAKGKDTPHRVFLEFLARLRAVRVLDPACGSGNFLYVALQLLKDLEKEAIIWGAETMRLTQELPVIGPEVVRGIEKDPYAAELARVTIWIGEIQWMLNNGWHYRTNPILKSLESVESRDAILDRSVASHPQRADWPDADYIVGNPPFLGGKQMRHGNNGRGGGLGDEYVDALFVAWDQRVPREADLVCYWHERAREMIELGRCKRAGLLATQGIRTGANAKVLEKIKATGDIFMAWSDEPWVVDGADVRISIIAQDNGNETQRELNGEPAAVIHANLSGGAADTADVTTALTIPENEGIAFMADTKGGAFDCDEETAKKLMSHGPNPNGKPNTDVVVPWVSSFDVTRRPRHRWIIDFGVDLPETEAALYDAPFEHVRAQVRPKRLENNRPAYAKRWWIHVEPRPAMRRALAPLSRFIATPTTSRYRVFVWLRPPALPDHQLIVFAREDDWFFGVLHSRVHEVWSLMKVGRKGVGNDPVYAPSFAFDTFPLPPAPLHHEEIATAARDLDETRARWLNPPELVVTQPGASFSTARDAAAAAELKKRTLTALYKTRPGWLDGLHRRLDEAVIGAYGWPLGITDREILTRLLALNRERAAGAPSAP